MGLLQYANLGLTTDFQRAQRDVFNGLGDLYRHLRTLEHHLVRDEAILRIGWSRADAPDWARPRKGDQAKAPPGVWIKLDDTSAHAGAEQIEATMAAFLDEGARDVHERSPWPDDDDGRDDRDDRDDRDRDQPRDEPARKRPRFPWLPEHRIAVRDRDTRAGLLLLDRLPSHDNGRAVIALRPNTYVISKQIRAVQHLQDAPTEGLRPLIQLLLPVERVTWPAVVPATEPEWRVLTQADRAGTASQREFVRRALATPDFAMLEGPPGSGKTTAICELVLQMVAAGKRVLLCASTHVAVDNVLERMIEFEHGGDLVAVRIGDEGNVSEAVRPYCLRTRLATEQAALRTYLERQRPGTPAQQLLLERLRRGRGAIERMVLDAANLVCGTTIGILQHPEIRGTAVPGEPRRRRSAGPLFDMMILDEASKTTFQEFLVPAVLARRWIIVGDPKQLSPYVETEELAVGLEAAVEDPLTRQACLDVFRAKRGKGATVVVTVDPTVAATYQQQGAGRGVEVALASAPPAETEIAGIVVATPRELGAVADRLPLDVSTVRGDPVVAWRVNRRMRSAPEAGSWSDELAWRLVRSYEQRRGGSTQTLRGLKEAVDDLAPAGLGPEQQQRYDNQVAAVRRVALPSVIELLRDGFEGGQRYRATALNCGFADSVLAERRVLLEYQHRMHPEIAALPREVVYQGEALQDAPDMAERRQWDYPGPRAVWVHVDGGFEDGNINPAEIHAVMSELDEFTRWARGHGRRTDSRPWEVAVLAFYRGQERALRHELRGVTRQHDEHRLFTWHGVSISLCTVDRFQGHEADLVLLSFANAHASNFLESENRLNVALTRARYGLRIFGNRVQLGKSKAPLLAALQRLPNSVRWQGGVQ
jgi:hypothetical protein